MLVRPSCWANAPIVSSKPSTWPSVRRIDNDSAPKPERWPATDTGPADEEAAGVRLIGFPALREALLRSGDEQQVEIRATEGAAARPLPGHLRTAVGTAGGRPPP